MNFYLNPKGREYFNNSAEIILSKLKSPPERKSKRKKRQSSELQRPFIDINPTDVIDFKQHLSTFDKTGNETSRYFVCDGQPIGLDETLYTDFNRICAQLYDKKYIFKYLSFGFIKQNFFDWLEKRYKRIIDQNMDLISYLENEADYQIRCREIKIPISFLNIETPFKVDNVKFDYFTKEYFDNINKMSDELKKKYQGQIYASIKTVGDESKCIEIAFSQSKLALLIIRFFSIYVFIPELNCYFDFMGKSHLPEQHYFQYIGSDTYPTISESSLEKLDPYFMIGNDELVLFKKSGLDMVVRVLTKKIKTDFEELILNTFKIFDRAISSNDYLDKVIFSLSALETLLLVSNTEPIEYNIGLRLGFLIEEESNERENIIKIINSVYKIRSSYLHHGRKNVNYKLLAEFLHKLWFALLKSCELSSKFKTQIEYIDYIKKKILS